MLLHMVNPGLETIPTVGLGFTVTVTDAVPVQPVTLSVPVTVYVPEVLTVIDGVISVVFHTNDAAPDAVKVVDCPVQMFKPLLAAIANVGASITVIVKPGESIHGNVQPEFISNTCSWAISYMNRISTICRKSSRKGSSCCTCL